MRSHPRARPGRAAASVRRLSPPAAFVAALVFAGACAPDSGSGQGSATPSATSASTVASTTTGGVSTAKGLKPQDFRTLDPCSYVAPETFTAFVAKPSAPVTAPGVKPPIEQPPIVFKPGLTFTRCIVEVRVEGGGLAEVRIEAGEKIAEAAKVDAPGNGATVENHEGTRVVKFPQGTNRASCQRTIVDDDLRMISLTAALRGSKEDACPIADTAVSASIQRAREGALRSRTSPKNSLALLRACELLSGPVLAKIPGLDPRQTRTPNDFSCTVGNEQWPVVMLDFYLVKASAPALGSNAREIVLAGRKTSVQYHPAGRDNPLPPRCTAETPVGAFGNEGYVEVPEISVVSAQMSEAQLCGAAETVAADIWAKLARS